MNVRVFLRRFRAQNRVPRISNQVPTIREIILGFLESEKIGCLGSEKSGPYIHTRYLTFSLKKTDERDKRATKIREGCKKIFYTF